MPMRVKIAMIAILVLLLSISVVLPISLAHETKYTSEIATKTISDAPHKRVNKLAKHATIKELENPYVILHHHGGDKLPHNEMVATIQSVVSELPNIKYNKATVDLITETLIVETNMGGASYGHAAKHWANYGIAQFTRSSAKHVLDRLRKERPDVYKVVDKMYDHKKTLTQNLMTNVKLSIALCAEYYWLSNPKFHNQIGTKLARARFWKRVYNTSAGSGSVDSYNKAVTRYYQKNKLYAAKNKK
jgi:hypothetical protein